MSKEKKYRDEEWLREKYVEEKLLQREIGDICDVDQAVISEWINKFDISKETPKHKKPEWIQSKLEEGLSQQEIADLTDITYDGIRYQIRKNNLGIFYCEADDCEERYPTEEGLLQHQSRDHPELEENSYGLKTEKVENSLMNNLQKRIDNKENQFAPEVRNENLQKARSEFDEDEHSEFMEKYWEELDEEDYPVNQDSFWPKYLDSRDNWGPNWRTIDETGHEVASDWEAEVDIMLHNSSLYYEYEGKTFTIEDTWNTPDFIGNGWILEVKSPAGYRDKERLDMVGKYLRDEVEERYIILGEGIDMPCNEFVEWSDRDNIISILSEYTDGCSSLGNSVFHY